MLGCNIDQTSAQCFAQAVCKAMELCSTNSTPQFVQARILYKQNHSSLSFSHTHSRAHAHTHTDTHTGASTSLLCWAPFHCTPPIAASRPDSYPPHFAIGARHWRLKEPMCELFHSHMNTDYGCEYGSAGPPQGLFRVV